jgi:sterol desaturase/sphingolipid hydroxylase (fatty acid hydroxylase superfamily)
MIAEIAKTALMLLVLLVVFRAIEHTRPREKRKPLLRAGFATDVAYWFFHRFVTKVTSLVAVALVLGPIALLIHGTLDRTTLLDGFGPAAELPLWQQAIAILLISDFAGYWMHRWFHRGRLWRFHAIHHSSTELDWLAAARAHPVNDAVMRIVTTLPILLFGFAPKAVLGIVPIVTFMAVLGHANVDWDWGPFRRVLASPRFHRWHHTSESEGGDRNFAGFFPVWDILFGTYYMPRDRAPERFGTDTPVPNGLVRQLIFPFRRTAAGSATVQPSAGLHERKPVLSVPR